VENVMGGPYLIGVAFWLFVGACAVTAIITEYKKRRMGVELLRAAIEKGQPLDPALVERVFAREEREYRIQPLHLKLCGIITAAAGLGVVVLAFFISQIAPMALYPILGAGILTICVGVGLLIGARVVAEAYLREPQSHSPR
jgi:hypothetical protein